jgi:hypothetical protein
MKKSSDTRVLGKRAYHEHTCARGRTYTAHTCTRETLVFPNTRVIGKGACYRHTCNRKTHVTRHKCARETVVTPLQVRVLGKSAYHGQACSRKKCTPDTRELGNVRVLWTHVCCEMRVHRPYVYSGDMYTPDKATSTCWPHLPHRYLQCPGQRQCCWCTGSTGLRDLKPETFQLKRRITFA